MKLNSSIGPIPYVNHGWSQFGERGKICPPLANVWSTSSLCERTTKSASAPPRDVLSFPDGSRERDSPSPSRSLRAVVDRHLERECEQDRSCVTRCRPAPNHRREHKRLPSQCHRDRKARPAILPPNRRPRLRRSPGKFRPRLLRDITFSSTSGKHDDRPRLTRN